MNYEKAVKNIRQELKTYILDNKIKSLVLGISGGIDSALCAALAKPVCDELNIPLIGRSLPTSSNASEENSRGKYIGKYFCTDFKEIYIQHEFGELADLVYEGKEEHAYVDSRAIQNGNIKARIRMIYLYDIASVNQGMVLSTDNYTEYLLGFSTIMGDWGDFGMIQNLWKTEVYEMSEWLSNNELAKKGEIKSDILSACINADATDGLGISKTDLDQIMPGWKGSSRDGYAEVDKRLKDFINFGTADLDDQVIYRHLKTEYKRKWPINLNRNKIF